MGKTNIYLGHIITPENRNEKKKEFFKIFMESLQANEKHKDMPHDEKKKAAAFFAKLELNREKKHYKSFLQGKDHYTYHGTQYKVLRDIEENPTYLSDVMNVEEVMERAEKNKEL